MYGDKGIIMVQGRNFKYLKREATGHAGDWMWTGDGKERRHFSLSGFGSRVGLKVMDVKILCLGFA